MVDLVLRPSRTPGKFYLELRRHGSMGEVEYATIASIDRHTADEIIRAGAPTWLFGEPKDDGEK
jgi:hypothetical protein